MTKKVIIIDDSLVSLNLIKLSFANSDWEVYGTQYAQDAVELIFDVAPDLIVTDAIMPVMGGFQLLKVIRSNPKISKIPVIVYSVLDNKNSKYYVKEERGEYYLQKNDDMTELINLADEAVKKHPVTDEYKFQILATSIQFNNITNIQTAKTEILQKPPLEFNKLEAQFKEKYDFTRSDDKILSDIFSILYPILEYNLATVCIYSPEKNDNIVYFDIRDIILSPIFQNEILHENEAKNSFLFKKYAPNLKVITNEKEMQSKISFEFEYNNKNIGKIAFYSKEKTDWINNPDIEVIKNVLDNFFRARHINKSSRVTKPGVINKYFIDKFDFKFDTQSNSQLYSAIIEIVNIKDLQDNLSSEDIDFINSKISEKLINFISDEEQIFKNDEDEYNLVFYAKDDAQAKQKLDWVVDLLSEITLDEYKIEAQIGACNCKIDEQFNFYEAQKFAREALENTTNNNRIIIYGSK